MINEYWTGNDMEGRDDGLLSGTSPVFGDTEKTNERSHSG
jgi:hypothetical protein